MKMQNVRELGRHLGLTFRVGTTKTQAIRAIQLSEGNFDCFGRARSGFCDQQACLFRHECLRLSQVDGAVGNPRHREPDSTTSKETTRSLGRELSR